jgi:DNA mismatch endonuclease (patch repair protein)
MTDNLTSEQRSYCMSRIKGKDTDLEMRVRCALHRRGLRFRKHVKELPENQTSFSAEQRLQYLWTATFGMDTDSSFVEDKVSDFWKQKIAKKRERDAGNHRKLRKIGWVVIRLWQHEINKEFDACIDRICEAVCGPEDKEKSFNRENSIINRGHNNR